MKDSQVFDVVVVGAGPGGAAAAKRCADRGLNTLLIEKKELPRDKVCSGMIMGQWALEIIRQEFGQHSPIRAHGSAACSQAIASMWDPWSRKS